MTALEKLIKEIKVLLARLKSELPQAKIRISQKKEFGRTADVKSLERELKDIQSKLTKLG